MQRKPGVKCFLYCRVWRHLCHIQNFVTSLLCVNGSSCNRIVYKALSVLLLFLFSVMNIFVTFRRVKMLTSVPGNNTINVTSFLFMSILFSVFMDWKYHNNSSTFQTEWYLLFGGQKFNTTFINFLIVWRYLTE